MFPVVVHRSSHTLRRVWCRQSSGALELRPGKAGHSKHDRESFVSSSSFVHQTCVTGAQNSINSRMEHHKRGASTCHACWCILLTYLWSSLKSNPCLKRSENGIVREWCFGCCMFSLAPSRWHSMKPCSTRPPRDH